MAIFVKLLVCFVENVILNLKIWKFFRNLILRLIADSRITALRIVCTMTSTILWMMMSFLTDQWKFDYTYAAAIRNVWSGSTLALPLILIHVSDTLTGDFYMSSLGSFMYSIMMLRSVMGKKISYLYVGLTLTVVGLACIETSLSNFEIKDGKKIVKGDRLFDKLFGDIFGDDSDDEDDDQQQGRGRKKPRITCRTSTSSLIAVAFLSMLILIYVNVIKTWHARVLIGTIFVSLQTINFIIGKRTYSTRTGLPKAPRKSLIVTILRVLVASTSKLFHPHPGRTELLYKGGGGDEPDGPDPDVIYWRHEACNTDSESESESDDSEKSTTDAKTDVANYWKSTSGMKCLDKAAIILETDAKEKKKKNSWRLCSVAEVELTKMVLHMFPLWTTCILLGVVSSIGDTYFLEQANQLERQLGGLKIPLIALLGCQKLAGVVITKIFEKATQRIKHKKIIHASLSVAMAMVFSVLCCIVASKVEKKRLKVVISHGLIDKNDQRIPMSIFWLVPQFILLGGLDTMFEQGNNGLSSRFPMGVVRYMALSTTGINGIGRIGGVLSVFLVGRITLGQHKTSWFQSTLNKSRLDQYYWLLAAMSGVALAAYAIAACWHFYRESSRTSDEGEEAEHEHLIEKCHWCCCG